MTARLACLSLAEGSLNAHAMLFGAVAGNIDARHNCYVAGRYRDGSRSDSWTDVTRCAYATFVRYIAACECGWLGKAHPATPAGYKTCTRELVREHHAAVSTLV